MKEAFWKHKKVLVTGGTGFIGSHLVEQLVSQSAIVRVFDRMSSGKIRFIEHLQGTVDFIKGDCSNPEDALKACTGMDVVMNLAAKVGGIEYNMSHQADMFAENIAISSNMIASAQKAGVDRFLVVSSACVYPHDAMIPTPETEGMRSEPEPTNSGYGWAKRFAEIEGQLYAKQYDMKIGIVRPYNAYGPRDDFNPATSHVIPALIRRVMSEENPVVVWGSGKQSRAFLYVEDFARGLMQAIEKYPIADPINIGTNEETTIKDLIELIVKISGKNKKIIFDTTKPDGSPRRNSDNIKAKEKTEFVATTGLSKGLEKTIEWYKANLEK